MKNFNYKIKLSKFTQHSPFSTISNTSSECATIRILPENLTINLEEIQHDIVALLLAKNDYSRIIMLLRVQNYKTFLYITRNISLRDGFLTLVNHNIKSKKMYMPSSSKYFS